MKNMRGHHLRDLFFEYLIFGKNPKYYFKTMKYNFKIAYPLFISDAVDDQCKKCKNYPERNFCAGPEIKKMDLTDATILGIKLNTSYSKRELKRVFMRNEKRCKSLRQLLREDKLNHDETINKFRKLKPLY